MRHMGAIGFTGAEGASVGITPSAMDPALKARMMAEAANVDDAKGRDLLDIAEASRYGARQRWVRMGIGAGVGLLVGFVSAKAMRKRR